MAGCWSRSYARFHGPVKIWVVHVQTSKQRFVDARDKTKNIFLHFFIEFKTYHLLLYFDAIEIDLAHHRVFVAQW